MPYRGLDHALVPRQAGQCPPGLARELAGLVAGRADLVHHEAVHSSVVWDETAAVPATTERGGLRRIRAHQLENDRHFDLEREVPRAGVHPAEWWVRRGPDWLMLQTRTS